MGLGKWLREQTNKPPYEPPHSGYGPSHVPIGAVGGFGESDTTGWPQANMTPELRSAVSLYGDGRGSYIHIYRSQPTIYTVVEFLSWQASQVGLKTYRRVSDTERPELSDHPVNQLISHPAPGLTYERLIHGTVADLGVFGNAYWRKMEQGNERWIVPLPPAQVEPRGGTILQASEYVFSSGGQIRTFGAEEILHFRRYNPHDPRIGVSPLEPLRRILAEEDASGRNREGLWANAARIEGIIERPPAETSGTWDDVGRKRFREDWQNVYSGSNNAGKTAILEDGMTWKPASFSPKDSEFIAGRKLTLETVARAYNIPLPVLGLTDTATYASQKEFHTALYVDTLAPWLKMLQGEIALGIVPWVTDETDIYVEFNIAEKLRGDFEQQVDSLRNAVQVPYMSPNLALKLLGFNPVDDPDFDVPAKPANYTYGTAPAAPVLQSVPTAAVDLAEAKEHR